MLAGMASFLVACFIQLSDEVHTGHSNISCCTLFAMADVPLHLKRLQRKSLDVIHLWCSKMRVL
jgi:hypothetical protein